MFPSTSQPSHLEAQLDIRIWITPDGKIYFHNINSDVIALAYELDPGNSEIAQRYAIIQQEKRLMM